MVQQQLIVRSARPREVALARHPQFRAQHLHHGMPVLFLRMARDQTVEQLPLVRQQPHGRGSDHDPQCAGQGPFQQRGSPLGLGPKGINAASTVVDGPR